MYMVLLKKYTTLLLLFILLSFYSCREDIIPPDNPIGEINEPIRLTSNNSYTFILNANNISTTVQDHPGLNSQHSVLVITLTDYEQGNVSLKVSEFSKQLVYQKTMTDNIDQLAINLDYVSPDIVNIIFTNFTGKLKIEVDIH